MKIKGNKIQRLFKFLYLKLSRIKGSAQKIALSFGLGVFIGVMPGIGPVGAVVSASILKLNKLAAFLGSIVTNTWVSFLSIFLSIKIGSFFSGADYQSAYKEWLNFINGFNLSSIPKIFSLSAFFPFIIGYVVISLIAGILAYVTAFILIKSMRRRRLRQTPEKI
jgi:uncharacterized protein (DUF2062 family)